MFHKVKSVTPLPDYMIMAHFNDGSDKVYDMKLLMEKNDVFRNFEKIPGLFELARPDVGGYGIIWNDDIDIDAEEVWQNGENTRTAFTGLMALSDATAIWGLNESTLRKAINYGKLKPGIDVINFGSQWVVTAEAMEREYSMNK